MMGSNVFIMAAAITMQIHIKDMQYEISTHSKNTVIVDDK